MFPQLIIILNNFIKYNLIIFIFIAILYNFKIKKPLNLLKIEDLYLNNLIKIIAFINISLKNFE